MHVHAYTPHSTTTPPATTTRPASRTLYRPQPTRPSPPTPPMSPRSPSRPQPAAHPQLITPAATARHTAAHLNRSPHARSPLHPQPVTPADHSRRSHSPAASLIRSPSCPQPTSRLSAVASRPASPQLQLHSYSLNHRNLLLYCFSRDCFTPCAAAHPRGESLADWGRRRSVVTESRFVGRRGGEGSSSSAPIVCAFLIISGSLHGHVGIMRCRPA